MTDTNRVPFHDNSAHDLNVDELPPITFKQLVEEAYQNQIAQPQFRDADRAAFLAKLSEWDIRNLARNLIISADQGAGKPNNACASWAQFPVADRLTANRVLWHDGSLMTDEYFAKLTWSDDHGVSTEPGSGMPANAERGG